MKKKVLLLCASHNDLGMMLGLKKMGFYIIATGGRAGAPAEKYADEYIQADYSDKELILRIAKEKRVDAVCQCCNDFGVYTAAYVAEKLGLPGYDSYKTTLLLHNKDRFKEFAIKNKIITPEAHSFDNENDAIAWIEENAEYPIIVKPSDASAGNGISSAENFEAAQKSVHYAFENSRNKHILVEPFISGSQHGFTTFLIDQKVAAVCSCNENSIVNSYRVEIDTFPASTHEQAAPLLIEEIERIAQLLHLKDGIFHLQYIFMNGTPYILEVMRRTLGNMYFVPGNQLTGMDWDYWDARAHVGLDMNHFPCNPKMEGFFAYKTLVAPHNGRVKDIKVSEELKKHIYYEFPLWQPGCEVTHWQSEPLGFIFTTWSTAEEMRTALIDNYGGVEVLFEE